MENNNISEDLNQQPIGSLFDTIDYYNLEDLDKFISDMNHDQALYCVIQAVKAAYKRNSFTISESEVVSKSLRKLSTPNTKPLENAPVEENN